MPKRILIVDDSMFMRKILSDILVKKYLLSEASTGSQAMGVFIRERPDLVLLDIILPEGEEEGISLLKQIMKLDPKQAVLMISAIGLEVMMAQCKKLGARGYITKPFDFEQVISTVEEILK